MKCGRIPRQPGVWAWGALSRLQRCCRQHVWNFRQQKINAIVWWKCGRAVLYWSGQQGKIVRQQGESSIAMTRWQWKAVLISESSCEPKSSNAPEIQRVKREVRFSKVKVTRNQLFEIIVSWDSACVSYGSTPSCKTLGGNAELAVDPAKFCLAHRQMRAKGIFVT